MEENFNIFDFKLSDEDMEEIKKLETNVPIADINTAEFVEFITNY